MNNVLIHPGIIRFDLIRDGEPIAFTMDPPVATLMDKRAVDPASASLALATYAKSIDLLSSDMIAAGSDRHISVGVWMRWVENGGRL